jgi:hypothetical protein
MITLTGTDDLVVGSVYVINLSGTTDVWTVEDTDIYLRRYDATDDKQLFEATLDADNRYGFYNKSVARRVNRNKFENVKCDASYDTEGTWESFAEIRAVAPGKREFLMTVYDAHRPLRMVKDSKGEYFTIQKEGTHVTFGLTKVA